MLDPGAWTSYAWTSNTGFNSSDRSVSISTAGLYWVEVTSARGCIVQDTFLLETSADLLKANFLMASEAIISDTVVMIDVSWPWPRKDYLDLPSEMHLLEDYEDLVFGTFAKAGEYKVSLTTSLADCLDEITKSITIYDSVATSDEGRLGNESFVKEFTLYPNPNEGIFDVGLEFMEESPVILTVFNMLTSRKAAQIRAEGKMKYSIHFDLRPFSAGTYTLRLDYKNGTKYIRFVVR